MNTRKIAVVIDVDNTQLSKIGTVLQTLSNYGKIVVKRAYGNWRKETLKNWEPELKRLAIKAMQQFDYVAGKNATDIALVIDAMDLLYAKNCDAFAIVSSDSDYTPLAIRLHESDVYVIGVGMKNTPASFQNSCDEFLFLENIKTEKQSSVPTSDSFSWMDAENVLSDFMKSAADGNEDDLWLDEDDVWEGWDELPDCFQSEEEEVTDSITDSSVSDCAYGSVIPFPVIQESETAVDRLESTEILEDKHDLWESDGAAEQEHGAFGSVVPFCTALLPFENSIPADTERLQELHDLLKKAWLEHRDDKGFAHMGQVGGFIKQIKPDFDCRAYGYSKLLKFLEDFPDKYEIKWDALTVFCKVLGEPNDSHPLKGLDEIHALLKQAYLEERDASGFVNVGAGGNFIKQKKPNLDLRIYGYSKLSKFLEDFPQKYKLKRIDKTILLYRCID